MSEPEFVSSAASDEAIVQLGQSYYTANATTEEKEIDKLYQIWYYTNTANDESVRCRFYFKYYNYYSGVYGYWNAYADFNTLTLKYTYEFDSGNAATENNNGLTAMN